MSAVALPERRSWQSLAANPWVVAGSIAAGIVVGEIAPALADQLGVIGDLYLVLLKMVVLPFMVSAVIFSLRQLLGDPRSVNILPRILVAFSACFALAALAGLLTGLLVAPGHQLSAASLVVMGKLAGTGAATGSRDAIALFGTDGLGRSQGLGEVLLTLIPGNIFAALTQGDALKVLAFSLLFGLAVGQVLGRGAATFSAALQTVYHACLRLNNWFNLALPLVLFSILASQTARTGLEPLQAMARFTLALGLASLLVVLLSLGALRAASGRPWAEVLHSQRQSLLLAVATRNSPACMPAMIAGLAEQLGFARSRMELLVPLGVSLLRTGPALYYVVATAFVAQLYDVHLGAMQLGVVAVGAILAGLASSGMSGLITVSLTGLLCRYLGLPFEVAFVLFAAVDPLCDMLRTLVLVASCNAFAAVAGGPPAASEG